MKRRGRPPKPKGPPVEELTVAPKLTRLSKETWAAAIRAYDRRVPIKMICAHFGIKNYNTLYYHLKRAGRSPDRYADSRSRGHKPAGGYPTSGDPNMIGEHEVPPVCCPNCRKPIPWKLIKGYRD